MSAPGKADKGIVTSQGGGPASPIPRRAASFVAQEIGLLQLLADRVFRMDTRRASRASNVNDTGGNARHKNKVCQRTPPDSAGFFILAVRRRFRRKGPFRVALALLLRSDSSGSDFLDERARVMRTHQSFASRRLLNLPAGLTGTRQKERPCERGQCSVPRNQEGFSA